MRRFLLKSPKPFTLKRDWGACLRAKLDKLKETSGDSLSLRSNFIYLGVVAQNLSTVHEENPAVPRPLAWTPATQWINLSRFTRFLGCPLGVAETLGITSDPRCRWGEDTKEQIALVPSQRHQVSFSSESLARGASLRFHCYDDTGRGQSDQIIYVCAVEHVGGPGARLPKK